MENKTPEDVKPDLLSLANKYLVECRNKYPDFRVETLDNVGSGES